MAYFLSRNKQHEYIMICIYDALTYISINEEFSLQGIMEDIFELPYDEIPYFSKEIVIKSLSHIDDIIPAFQQKMTKWKFSRLNSLERAILLMSYTHRYYSEKPEKNIVIDIAVKLAKKYLDKYDYKFVNAILHNVLWMKTSFQ